MAWVTVNNLPFELDAVLYGETPPPKELQDAVGWVHLNVFQPTGRVVHTRCPVCDERDRVPVDAPDPTWTITKDLVLRVYQVRGPERWDRSGWWVGVCETCRTGFWNRYR